MNLNSLFRKKITCFSNKMCNYTSLLTFAISVAITPLCSELVTKFAII